jgi:hypothetical protein
MLRSCDKSRGDLGAVASTGHSGTQNCQSWQRPGKSDARGQHAIHERVSDLGESLSRLIRAKAHSS